MARYCRKRLVDPRMFDKSSFRTISLGREGKKGIIGCPKGYWKRGRCTIGTRLQAILYPEGSEKCPKGGRELANPRYLSNHHIFDVEGQLEFIVDSLMKMGYSLDDIREYLRGLRTKSGIRRAYESLERQMFLRNPKESGKLSTVDKIKFIASVYKYQGWSNEQIRDLIKMLVDLNFVDKYYKTVKKVYGYKFRW